MGFKRRSLLKATGFTLAAWAMQGAELDSRGRPIMGRLAGQTFDQSLSVLAAPARQKFALLIGIDQYGSSNRCPNLFGCAGDLAIQRNLLIHRFGFQPENILTLQNKQASRSNLQTAFLEHLLAQVSADDAVFVHFSGYGSIVQTQEGGEMQRSLVLYDSCSSAQPAVLRDLPESALLLLLRALPTERIVSVLDTGYRLPEDSPSSEGVMLRTRPSPPPAPFDSETLALQSTLQQQLDARGLLPKPAKSAGIILRATDLMPAALELDGQAGAVGLMTYALSQQLWNVPESASWRDVLTGVRLRLAVELSAVQTPQLLPLEPPGRSLEKSGLKPITPQGGVGAITGTRNSNHADLWLGGLASPALAYCGAGSVFQVLPSIQEPLAQPVLLQVQQRSGLQAQARLYRSEDGAPTAPVLGCVVREQIRVIPRQMELAIAIDQRLDRIERVDATSALTAIPQISVVALRSQPADYIFGRVAPKQETLIAALPKGFWADASPDPSGPGPGPEPPEEIELPGSEYGLLTLGHEVLPATLGVSAEAIKTAVQRLQPHLETLRAAKNLQLLDNALTTQLTARSRWEVLAAAASSSNGSPAAAITSDDRANIIRLNAGERLRYQLKNESDRPIYTLIVGFDPQGRWLPWNTSHLLTPLAPGSQIQGDINLSKRPGLTDLYTLCCTSPYDSTYALLTGNTSNTVIQPDQPITQPYAFSKAILQDIAKASQSLNPQISNPQISFSGDVYPLNLQTWSALRQTCERV